MALLYNVYISVYTALILLCIDTWQHNITIHSRILACISVAQSSKHIVWDLKFNVDPLSVELYTKPIELLFALLSIGLSQLAVEKSCVNQIQLAKTKLINYHLCTSYFLGLDPIFHSPCMCAYSKCKPRTQGQN